MKPPRFARPAFLRWRWVQIGLAGVALACGSTNPEGGTDANIRLENPGVFAPTGNIGYYMNVGTETPQFVPAGSYITVTGSGLQVGSVLDSGVRKDSSTAVVVMTVVCTVVNSDVGGDKTVIWIPSSVGATTGALTCQQGW